MSAGTTFRRRAVRAARRAALVAVLGVAASIGTFFALDARSPFPLEALAAESERAVTSADGGTLARRVAADEQWRRPVALADMGRWLPLAAVAVEDARFRRHAGVDPLSVVRAALVNVRAGRVRQGGSTITMQLVGMLLDTRRTFPGKALEAFRALQLERALTKDRILEEYLNRVPLGGNVVGVGAGARAWFGKEPRDLTLDEAALLAGLPQSPERLRPDRFPEAARARRHHVLACLLREGHIDAEVFERADGAPVPHEMRTAAVSAPGALHAVERALEVRPTGCVTTLDPVLQRTVLGVVERHARSLPAGADVAALVIEVEAAAVRAYVGSADALDPLDGQVDGVRAWRSPGSALKPFVYAAALEAGRLEPGATVLDAPIEFEGWSPGNFEDGFAGEVSVGEALRRSLNTPAFRVAERAGIDAVLGTVEAVGIELGADARGRSGLAVVTGAAPVRLVDLATGYATLARGGVFVPTRLVEDTPRARGTRVLSTETCDALFAMLSDAARPPRVRGGASHVGGHGFMWKTGTSSGHADAVAAGHDHSYAIAAWVGRFDGAGDRHFVGAEVAEPILAELFAALAERP